MFSCFLRYQYFGSHPEGVSGFHIPPMSSQQQPETTTTTITTTTTTTDMSEGQIISWVDTENC